ncbi:MAG: ion transporter [Paludibacteraceae bacterium]|nr:ion transporter [Paludibacteraceae bacterium]
MTLLEFKKRLSLVFDDNTKTVVWKNHVDYTIWAIIIISTIAIFLSTYEGVNEKYGTVLDAIDIVTTILFTIEVSLRIWTIDILEPKYSGFLGRVKYCLSFYGLIDFVSTYSYYINFFVPLPLDALKAIRVARLLRIFRFMKSFRLLTTAFGSKKEELLVSLQFLSIITIILSFVLFFAEHEAQPDVYSNGMTPVIWAFMQYIGDPGGFGDYPPITIIGRIIACVIGILGIAIFAVPAGLIGAGFTEAMEEEEKNKKNRELEHKILTSFYYSLDRETRLYPVPRYTRLNWLQTRLGVSPNDIIDAVQQSPILRLKDLASAQPTDKPTNTELMVETFPANTVYGCCIDRGSNITIVATTSATEPSGGNFCFFLAKLGKFNYVSKEYDVNPVRMTSYLNIEKEEINGKPHYLDDRVSIFLDDIRKLSNRENSIVIAVIASDARITDTSDLPTQFHFQIGHGKNPDGKPNYACDGLSLQERDIEKFDKMYHEFSEEIQAKYNYKTDVQQYGALIRNKYMGYHLGNNSSSFCLRIACSVLTWSKYNIATAIILANAINKQFAPQNYPLTPSEDLQKVNRLSGTDYGFQFYEEVNSIYKDR